MKIKEANIYIVETGSFRPVIAELITDDGIIGIGEGSVGFGIGCKALIADLNTIKYSTNPYNVNSATMAAGVGALKDTDYFRRNCETIAETRAWTTEQLRRLGFRVADSKANFVFAAVPDYSGLALYQDLKANGILVRHFETPRLKDYNRITIGSRAQMEALIAAITRLLEAKPRA